MKSYFLTASSNLPDGRILTKNFLIKPPKGISTFGRDSARNTLRSKGLLIVRGIFKLPSFQVDITLIPKRSPVPAPVLPVRILKTMVASSSSIALGTKTIDSGNSTGRVNILVSGSYSKPSSLKSKKDCKLNLGGKLSGLRLDIYLSTKALTDIPESVKISNFIKELETVILTIDGFPLGVN